MLRVVALILGIILSLVGLAGIGVYAVGVVDIMIKRPPDQSWLFWGMPVAMIGVIVLIGGVGLLVLWRHLIKTEDRSSSAS